MCSGSPTLDVYAPVGLPVKRFKEIALTSVKLPQGLFCDFLRVSLIGSVATVQDGGFPL